MCKKLNACNFTFHLFIKLKSRKRWDLISSDRQVQQAVRVMHAEVISSQDFTVGWRKLSEKEPTLDPRNRSLSGEEITYCEDLFRGNNKELYDGI